MTQNLEGMGFTVVPFGQGFKDMSPPTKEFYKLLMEGRITHGGNPVMAWMAGNVVVDTDPAGNIKPTKANRRRKSMVSSLRSWHWTAASETKDSSREASTTNVT